MDVIAATELDGEQFASAVALMQEAERAIDPVTPPITAEELRRLIADDRSEANRHLRFAEVDGSTVRAFGHLELETNPANLHFAAAEVFGAATESTAKRAVLAEMVRVAADDGRTTLLGWGPATSAEAAFWASAGAAEALRERISMLDVADVDEDLMRRWTQRRTQRAAAYRLVRWADVCPDEYVAAYAETIGGLNDAPLGDVALEPWQLTITDVRQDEDARRSLGLEMLSMIALAPDGRPAGYTEILINPWRPDASWQMGTAVLEDHRNRGLGRWLKAEMWAWLRSEAPQVTRLRTGNAEVNAAMLSINVEMGFRPHVAYAGWQADVATYRTNLT